MSILSNLGGGLRSFYSENVAFDAEKRSMIYKIMAAQMEQGIPAAKACSSVLGTKLHPSIKTLARAGVNAADQGELVMDGWRRTGYIPSSELGILEVAEERDTLEAAFKFLADPKRKSVSFLKAAVVPKLQQLIFFSISLVFVLYSKTFFLTLPLGQEKAKSTLAYQYSSWLNDYGLLLGIGIFAFVFLMVYGRKNWLGGRRVLLLFFGNDWIYKIGLEYARLACDLYLQGASHAKVLEVSRKVLTKGNYVETMLTQIERATTGAGEPYAPSLSGKLLPGEYADYLGQVAPEDDPAENAKAFESIADMLHTILENRYRKIGTLLGAFLTAGTGAHVVLVITSIYGLFTDMQSFY